MTSQNREESTNQPQTRMQKYANGQKDHCLAGKEAGLDGGNRGCYGVTILRY